MRVLMLVQHLDESHWLRGFIVPWVRAIAARVNHVDVITLEYTHADLPENVTVQSMGKEHGHNRVRELLGFHRAMRRVVRDCDVIFSHMTPRYSWLAAPYALAFGKPQVLWFTHRQVSLELRMATAVCKRVVTAAPDSFPLPTPKLRALGHGIDTAFFAPKSELTDSDSETDCQNISHDQEKSPLHRMERGFRGEVMLGTASIPPESNGEVEVPSLSTGRGFRGGVKTPLSILHVARLMPIKHQATVIRALAQIAPDIDAQAVIIGAVPDANDQSYLDQLKGLAVDLGVADRVIFTGAIPAAEVRDWYRNAAIAVNPSPVGLFDKAVLESMATELPVITSNPAFDSLQGDYADRLRIASPDDVDGLTARIRDVLALPPDERKRMTAAIRERMIDAHSLDQLATRLVNVFRTGEP